MGAGATYCCSHDERKNTFKAYINNLQLTGIDGLGDLGNQDCPSKFKNNYETNLKLSRDSLVVFYNGLMHDFQSIRMEQNSHAKVNVKVIASNAGLSARSPCVLQQYKFSNQGKNFEIICKSVLDMTLSPQWDRKIIQSQVATNVINSNMLVLRQTVNNDEIVGPGMRELTLKRFFFRYQGRLYVYTSSVPEAILDSKNKQNVSDEEIKEDIERMTVIFNLQCFYRTKSDVFVNQI